MSAVTRTCPQCGASMPEGARFCGDCGAVLPVGPVERGAGAEASDREGAAVDSAFASKGSPTAEVPVLEGAAATVVPAVEGSAVARGSAAEAGPSGKRSRKRVFAIAGVAGVCVLALGVGIVLFATGFFGPKGLAIDESVFPDEMIRAAIAAQVDTDGDGVLSQEEQDAVTGFVASRGQVAFVLNGETVDPEALLNAASGESAAGEADGAAADASEGASTEAGGASETEGSENSEAPASDTDASAEPSAEPATGDSPEGEGTSADASEGTSEGEGSKVPEERVPVIDGLGVFPNLKTMVVRNAGLTELNLSACPNVEYVDCRENDLASLNLASNANLTTLFCDEDVPLEGLDEAGLYFTDLITGAFEADMFTGKQSDTWTVEYDTFGRPIRVSTQRGAERTYTYDDQGRLTRAEWNSSDWEEYSYGENGLLNYNETFFTLDVDSTNTFRTTFGYDENGMLTQSQMGYGDQDVSQRKSFWYADGRPSACFFENLDANGSERGAFEFDAGGMLTATRFYSEESGFQELTEVLTYEYDQNGMLAHRNQSSLWNCERGGTNYDTDYNDQGLPLHTELSSGMSQDYDASFDYSCNIDGYVTQAQTYKPTYERAISLGLSYIKMVGSLADRPSRRYVPQFSVGFGSDAFLNGGKSFTMGQEWGQDTGSTLDVTVQEVGPAQAAYRAMGLMPRTISNPNELKLAAYDAAHWADGLNLNGPSLIFEEQEEPADSSMDGTSADLYDVQIGGFGFNLPESWRDKVEVTYGEIPEGGTVCAQVALKDQREVCLISAAVLYTSTLEGDVEEGDFSSLSLATIPIDEDKELLITSTTWPAILYYYLESEHQTPENITQDQWRTAISLVTGDQTTYEDIAEAASLDSEFAVTQILIDMQKSYLTSEIVDKIVIA